MTKKYPSKISFPLLIFVFVLFFGPFFSNIVKGEFSSNSILAIALLTVIFLLILPLFFRTIYIIDGNELKVKCGYFSYKPIKIDQIQEISKTRSIMSSPAPSFDRILIKYEQHNEIILSPKHKEDFASMLTKINPKIKNKLSKTV